MHFACHDYPTFNGAYIAKNGGLRGREQVSETEGEQNRQPKGGKESWQRESECECAHAKMKDNAINKIYKITNNALGISLIVT